MVTLPVFPTPTGGNTTAPLGSDSWFVVHYTAGQNQVSSRYVTTTAGQNMTAEGSKTVQAPSSSQAASLVEKELGVNDIITTVDGPFDSAAAAAADVTKYNATLNKASQAGKLPTWGLSITGIAAWFDRGLKLLFGGILIVAGVMRFSGAEKDAIQIIGTAAKGAVLA